MAIKPTSLPGPILTHSYSQSHARNPLEATTTVALELAASPAPSPSAEQLQPALLHLSPIAATVYAPVPLDIESTSGETLQASPSKMMTTAATPR